MFHKMYEVEVVGVYTLHVIPLLPKPPPSRFPLSEGGELVPEHPPNNFSAKISEPPPKFWSELRGRCYILVELSQAANRGFPFRNAGYPKSQRMAKSKLKSALDQYRGRNIRLEKQRKKEKEARKRKEQREAANENGEDDDAPLGGQKAKETAVKANRTPKKEAKAKKNGAVKNAEPAEEPEWETDESEEELDSDEERTKANLAKLEDSDSEGSSEDDLDEDEDEEVGDEEEEDVPLSDIESLASEDKEDIVPHQRLTINNTTALTAALNRISLPYSKLTFSEHQSITSDEPTEIPDVEDDLNRELAFYKQSLAAVKDARAKLKQEGVPFSRPADYFAEMVKSDEHMGKIKQKLIDDAAGKKAAAEARRQRDLKKFGKQVQVAKLQERAKEKRDTLEKINILKRSKSPLLSPNQPIIF